MRSGLGATGGVGTHTVHIYRQVLQVVNVRDGIGTQRTIVANAANVGMVLCPSAVPSSNSRQEQQRRQNCLNDVFAFHYCDIVLFLYFFLLVALHIIVRPVDLVGVVATVAPGTDNTPCDATERHDAQGYQDD